jgi:hypothetical protein
LSIFDFLYLDIIPDFDRRVGFWLVTGHLFLFVRRDIAAIQSISQLMVEKRNILKLHCSHNNSNDKKKNSFLLTEQSKRKILFVLFVKKYTRLVLVSSKNFS